ncbi:hypothetical protein OS242_02795 [Tumebacillus sp. DT12]|uniref:HEAT repeat domain-containing protein n=1 Tax=Tumebacillus lacus TaxID=2995335 RepID=A0ABT3WW28_9BACL|nr:hypothetical protein [Tumebacillus lacus]MCX7568888.1 hypothetical protein [Tumebacillus lacus]
MKDLTSRRDKHRRKTWRDHFRERVLPPSGLAKSRQQAEARRRQAKRHARSVVGFALWGLVDLGLTVAALQAGSVWPLAVRYPLTFAVAAWVQPFSEEKPWSARQSLTAWTAVLIPGLGSWIAAAWSLMISRPQGAWQDVPVALETYRSSIDWGGVLDVVPLIDVLDSPDPVRKKNTLLQIQTMRSAIEVSVVRRALDDEDPEVRYYAAGLLNYAENVHSSRIAKLEERLSEDPEDIGAWNDLSDEYAAIIREGIAGEELSQFFLEKRLMVLEQSLRLDPMQPVAGIAKAETLFQLGRLDEAEWTASEWISDEDGRMADAARAVLMRAAYQRGDQELLETLMGAVQDVDRLPEEVRDTVRFWRRTKEEAR